MWWVTRTRGYRAQPCPNDARRTMFVIGLFAAVGADKKIRPITAKRKCKNSQRRAAVSGSGFVVRGKLHNESFDSAAEIDDNTAAAGPRVPAGTVVIGTRRVRDPSSTA